jgi:hypothetical protein
MTQIIPIDTVNSLKDYTQIGYVISAAKTDFAISPAISSTQRLIVANLIVTLGADSSASASVRIAFAASTIPADADTGVAGLLAGHGKTAAGSGFLPRNGAGKKDEELRITCDTPTPGKLIVTYRYKIVNA